MTGVELNKNSMTMEEEKTVEREVWEALAFLSAAQKQRVIGFATCLRYLQDKEYTGECYRYHNNQEW